MNTNSRLVAGATVAALWQVAGHYTPCARPWDRPTVPERIGAYTWGVTGILLGIGMATDKRTLATGFIVAAAAGALTVAVYGLDDVLRRQARTALNGFVTTAG